jgi:flagellin
MSFSINTNAGAMAALRTLTSTQTSLSKTQSRIESGFKVGSAKDDPSTFVIAQGMRGDIGGLKAVKEGLNFGKASVNMASAAAKQVSETLNKLQEKVTQAGNPSLDQATLQSEADQLVSQIASIVESASFGGINLLDGSGGSMSVLSGMSGGGATTTIDVAREDATTAGLGIDGLDLSKDSFELTTDNALDIASGDTLVLVDGNGRQVTFEFSTAGAALTTAADEANDEFVVGVELDGTESALEALDLLKAKAVEQGFSMKLDGETVTFGHGSGMGAGSAVTFTGGATGATVASDALGDIDAAKNLIGDIMSNLGAAANRLDAQQEFTQVLIDTFNEGVGILVDANLAEESAKLQALQTKEQLGIQSLSIANQRPQSIMSLFRS